jgi:hypothetical protein
MTLNNEPDWLTPVGCTVCRLHRCVNPCTQVQQHSQPDASNYEAKLCFCSKAMLLQQSYAFAAKLCFCSKAMLLQQSTDMEGRSATALAPEAPSVLLCIHPVSAIRQKEAKGDDQTVIFPAKHPSMP